MKNDSTPATRFLQFPVGVETLGEKANYLHECSVNLAKKSTGAAILAGWVLSVARSTCAHGQWLGWLQKNVSFSRPTAQNYMSLYEQTLGAARANARRPIALSVEPTEEELDEAAHDIDGKPLSALYKSTGLMATSGNWGGKREDAGRKAKDVAEELKSDVEGELCANEGRDLIEELSGWALGADDGFGTLGDGELANAVKTLSNILARAREILTARNADRKSRS